MYFNSSAFWIRRMILEFGDVSDNSERNWNLAAMASFWIARTFLRASRSSALIDGTSGGRARVVFIFDCSDSMICHLSLFRLTLLRCVFSIVTAKQAWSSLDEKGYGLGRFNFFSAAIISRVMSRSIASANR